MSETLYNGIVLPRTWPPRHVDPGSREPLPVPYLEHPPAVIPIDLGRQLFVDDFLISETTLKRRFGRPEVHPSSPVLVPATPHELDGGQCPTAAPFNDGLWYDPANRLYKLWYLSGWMSTPALATSADGFEWERPALDVEPGTNLVWPTSPTYERDGCVVWLDLHAADPGQRYKMFQFYRGGDPRARRGEEGWLQTSPDGVHWSKPVITTPVGDNTSFFHNPFHAKWCMSVRRGFEAIGADGRTYYHRMRAYTESDDLLRRLLRLIADPRTGAGGRPRHQPVLHVRRRKHRAGHAAPRRLRSDGGRRRAGVADHSSALVRRRSPVRQRRLRGRGVAGRGSGRERRRGARTLGRRLRADGRGLHPPPDGVAG